MIARFVLALAVTALVTGCSLVSPPRPEPEKAVLSKLPAPIPHGRSRAAVLAVVPPEADQAYDTTRMAYRKRPYTLAYFRDHEWAEPPAAMIRKLLVGTLEGTGAFRSVLSPPDPLGNGPAAGYVLRTELRELVQDYTRTPPVLRLSIRVELLPSSGRRPATREITEEEPIRERTAYAGVIAANDALARALEAIARFVVERVS